MIRLGNLTSVGAGYIAVITDPVQLANVATLSDQLRDDGGDLLERLNLEATSPADEA